MRQHRTQPLKISAASSIASRKVLPYAILRRRVRPSVNIHRQLFLRQVLSAAVKPSEYHLIS